MPKVNLFADSLHILHNGKPEDIDKKFIKRNKNYIITVAVFSPGYNNNKRIEGGISFLDIDHGDISFRSTFALEDIHLLTCSYGSRVELTAHIFYVEYEDFLTAVLRSVAERLAGKFVDYAKKLELQKIARIPAEILPVFVDVIKKGFSRKSNMYEIGSSLSDSLENGTNELDLSVEKEVRRTLAFWTPDRGDYTREEVVLVPRGPNGQLKLLLEPVS
jgi:hypothetical protein